MKNFRYLLAFSLILGLVLSGCGLFQDGIDTDVPGEELSVADALNTFIEDYNVLVAAYVEQLIEFLDDDQVDESDPGVYDLDEEFEAVLAHYDELVMGGNVVDEETFKEMFIEHILWAWERPDVVWGNAVEISYKYKYFMELSPESWGGIFPFEYSEKPLQGFVAMVERTQIYVEEPLNSKQNNEQKTEDKYIIPIFFALVEYEDCFKVFYFLPFMKY